MIDPVAVALLAVLIVCAGFILSVGELQVRRRKRDTTEVPWEWCGPCGSYHHPDNPTCIVNRKN